MSHASAVLDTNVVISAHLKQEGLERFVLDLALAGLITIYLSEEIFGEYSSVLGRARFGVSSRLAARSSALIRRSAKFIQPNRVADLPWDPDDNKFLDCAAEAKADYLVTGNKRHFPRTWGATRVVSAREFLEELVPKIKR